VALYSSDGELLMDLLRQGFAGIAVVPESEAGGLGEDFRVLPIGVELPDYHLSLVCRGAERDSELIGSLLAAWRD